MIGILAALEHRRQTGQGQRVELDLFSCTISAQQQELTYYLNHGSIPARPAENHGSIWATAPFGLYPTADGGIAIAMTPCPIVGQCPRPAGPGPSTTRTRSCSSTARRSTRLLAARLKTGTTARWLEALLAHDVWCAPIQDYDDLVQDPQAAAQRHVLGGADR